MVGVYQQRQHLDTLINLLPIEARHWRIVCAVWPGCCCAFVSFRFVAIAELHGTNKNNTDLVPRWS